MFVSMPGSRADAVGAAAGGQNVRNVLGSSLFSLHKGVGEQPGNKVLFPPHMVRLF